MKPTFWQALQSQVGRKVLNAVTDIELLIFFVIHLNDFKFAETETIMIDEEQSHDLKSVVIDTFVNPCYAFDFAFVTIKCLKPKIINKANNG